MYNLYTKFVKILEICKQFSENLVNESGNVPRRGPVPKFSDLEVVALSLTAETESIDSEKWLFDYKLQEYKDCIPNLISRRQFNDRRKKTAGLCEELRKRVAMEMDGGEEQFFVDSKPIEVCRVARGKRCKMGRTGDFSQAPDFGFCASQNTQLIHRFLKCKFIGNVVFIFCLLFVKHKNVYLQQTQLLYIKTNEREWNSCINTYSRPWDIIVNSEKKKFIEG